MNAIPDSRIRQLIDAYGRRALLHTARGVIPDGIPEADRRECQEAGRRLLSIVVDQRRFESAIDSDY